MQSLRPPNTNQAAQPMNADEWAGRSDQQLLESIAQGNKAAMAEFITRFYRRILDFAQRHLGSFSDAEDIAQEAFTRVWLKAPSWQDRNLPAHSWLYRITYNLCIDELRRRKPETGSADEHEQSHDQLPERELYENQRQQLLTAALDALTLEQRTAIVLCNYQAFSNRDAAAVMGVTIEALESLLSRGRNKLRKLLIDT
jgi:RNA polymerase sigma factor (sigma-70 family)